MSKRKRLKRKIEKLKKEIASVHEDIIRAHEAYVGWLELKNYYEHRDDDDEWPF